MYRKYFSSRSGFTLIELLIVIGILAILTAAVVIVLNPTELLKQGRDSTRMTDMASMSKTIQLLLTQNPQVSLGTASTVYISLPDTSSTCTNLSLPTLPAGYTYKCVPTASSTFVNGTGWIPIDFTASGIQNLSKLPLDPTNTSSSGFYYTYIASSATFKMNARIESEKYKTLSFTDGGNQSLLFEEGSDVRIGPYDTCRSILEQNLSAGSGIYTVFNPLSGTVQVYCDMTTSGGGWTLLFQRRGGAVNVETCQGNVNAFLRNTCGTSTALAYTNSYSIDLDVAPRGEEYLFQQFDASMILDSDDAFIIKTKNILFPDKINTIENISVDQICDGSNQNCDTTDGYFKYTGNGYFSNTHCFEGYTSGYGGNYGYCQNGVTSSYTANGLFGTRSSYEETKLWAHTNVAKDYAERVYVR